MQEPTNPISLKTISENLREIITNLDRGYQDLAIAAASPNRNDSEIESSALRLERQFANAFRNLLRFIPSDERLDRELPPLSLEEQEAFRRYKTFSSTYLNCHERGYTRLLPIIEEGIRSLDISDNVYYHMLVDTIKLHRSDIDKFRTVSRMTL